MQATVDNASKKKQKSGKEPCIYVYLQKSKKPCINLQGDNLPPRGIERPSKDPYFYGISANAEISEANFDATQNFVTQIADLFDRLTVDEKEQVLKLLTARTRTAGGVMQN